MRLIDARLCADAVGEFIRGAIQKRVKHHRPSGRVEPMVIFRKEGQMKLQVQIDENWKYVFCRNLGFATPITTDDKRKALKSDAKPYFEKHFGNHTFREAK